MKAIQPIIIGIDFDGTCTTHNFPEIGEDIGAVPVLKELVAAGHQLILWTMRDEGNHRTGTPLLDAVKWFAGHGIRLYGVNQNPSQEWSKSPKAYCHLYIDDAALGCPLVPGIAGAPNGRDRPWVDWVEVRKMLVQRGVLTCPHCTDGYVQDNGFGKCNHCNP